MKALVTLFLMFALFVVCVASAFAPYLDSLW